MSQLQGRIAAVRKERSARGLAVPRRACVGLEGRGVHTEKDESALRLAATVAAVRAVSAARTLEAMPAMEAEALLQPAALPVLRGSAPRETSVAADDALDAAAALGDLEPGVGRGPGRRLGL